MASILASDYNGIATKLETLRSTVGGAWTSVSGLSAKPAVSAGTSMTAAQVNNLINAYNYFETLWIGSITCSATLGSCSSRASATNSATSGNCSSRAAAENAITGNCQALISGTYASTLGDCSTRVAAAYSATAGDCSSKATGTYSATDNCSSRVSSDNSATQNNGSFSTVWAAQCASNVSNASYSGKNLVYYSGNGGCWAGG